MLISFWCPVSFFSFFCGDEDEVVGVVIDFFICMHVCMYVCT